MSANYNLFYFFKQFPDEDACRKYLEKRRVILLSVHTAVMRKRFTITKMEKLSNAHTAKSNFR